MTQRQARDQRGRLIAAMKAAGVDDHQLADATGIDIRLIRRYLGGGVSVGVKNGARLARALGVSVEHVLYGDNAV